MWISTATKTHLAFIVALVIVSVIGGVSLMSTRSLVKHADSVAHTQEVRATLQRVLTGVNDAASAQRGYLATGGVVRMEQLENAEAATHEALDELRAKIADKGQLQRLTVLETLVRERVTNLGETIDAWRVGGPGFGPARELLIRGEDLAGRIQRACAAMESEEFQLLGERRQRANAAARLTSITILAGSGTAFVFLAVTALMIQREMAARSRARLMLAETVAIQRAILEGADYGIIYSDSDGTIRSLNSAAERMTGYTSDEVVGKAALTVVLDPDELAQRAAELTAELGHPVMAASEVLTAKAALGGADQREWTYIRKDGSRFPALVSVTAVRDDRGKLLGFMGIASDLTAHVEAQEAMRVNRDRWRFALEGSGDGVWDWNLQTNEVFFSPRWKSMLGFGAHEIASHIEEWTERIHPKDVAWVMEELQRHLRAETPSYQAEHRVRCKDGSFKLILGRGKVISRTSDGRPLRMVGTHADVSDRKRIETALQEAEERLENILGSSDAVVWSAKPAGLEVIYMSQGAERIFGQPASAFFQDPNLRHAIVHPEDSVRVADACALVATTGSLDVEYRIVRPNGDVAWIRDVARIVRDAEGTPIRLDGLAVDFTARRRAEVTLRETEARLRTSEEKFRALLEHASEAVVIIDQDGLIVLVNARFEELFGYRREEVLGKPTEFLVPEHSRERYRDLLAQYAQNPQARLPGRETRLTARRKDGGEVPVEITLSYAPTDVGLWIMGHIVDLRPRIEIERLKSEFVSTVSHELRTPLTSIHGALGLLAGGVAGPLPEQVQSLVKIAADNSSRLVRLVNDILDMEKGDAGKAVFNFKLVELMPIVEDAIEAMQAYGHQLGVSFRIDASLPDARVNGDADRLAQVLSNLLSNAAKFSPAGGVVSVAVTSEGPNVRVAVRDNGPGIPEAFQGRVFDKFAQADGADNRRSGGTGLGLSISKTIAEKHHGQIDFQTETGVGTTFYFHLPVVNRAAVTKEPPAVRKPPASILICEDDPELALLLRIMLGREGLVADIAHDAAQARQMLDRRNYLGMTFDLGQPGQNGVSVIRELRTREKTRELPIIIFSRRAGERSAELGGVAFGIIDWLGKPVDEERLRSAVARIKPRGEGQRPIILHVEEDLAVVRLVSALLKDDADLRQARSLEEARSMLAETKFDLILLNLLLSGGWGTDLLQDMALIGSPPPLVVFSAYEADEGIARRVAASLVTSRASNEQLVQTIGRLVAGRGVGRSAGPSGEEELRGTP